MNDFISSLVNLKAPAITKSDYTDAGLKLDCDPIAVEAFAMVESNGGGFLPSGRLKALQEGHYFHRLTGGKFTRSNPTVSYRRWTKIYYIGGEGEYRRINEAANLNLDAALRSTSWGKFQIMGDNCEESGFASVTEFVKALVEDEDNHLEAFVNFIIYNGLKDELQNLRWERLAAAYNGKGYRKNNYHVKLSRAYSKLKAAK
jgi:hypothetical protein